LPINGAPETIFEVESRVLLKAKNNEQAQVSFPRQSLVRDSSSFLSLEADLLVQCGGCAGVPVGVLVGEAACFPCLGRLEAP
jgi:hypothetical protein